MRLYLIAKNLNKELQEKIEEKERELENRSVVIGTNTVEDTTEIIARTEEMKELLSKCEKVDPFWALKFDFSILKTNLTHFEGS